ncbi:MAG TPA: SDR family oxidoreductase [Terriglobales bacterium]|nr:SDR family oxidoreductase [Terriglobales bacterium]
MKVLIFGATGGTGRALLEQALEQGHVVTAFARDPAKVRSTHQNLTVAQGNMLDLNSVEAAVKGQDAVLSALGTHLPVWTIVFLTFAFQILARVLTLTGPLGWSVRIGGPILALLFLTRRTTALSEGTKNIVQAMKKHGVQRLICESSLGVADSRGRLGIFYNLILVPLLLRNMFADKAVQEQIIQASGLAWVIVRPSSLTNGPRKGIYRAGMDIGGWFRPTKISRADVADFMLKQLTDDTYLRKTPGVAY